MQNERAIKYRLIEIDEPQNYVKLIILRVTC